MYKLLNPWTSEVMGYSEFFVTDRVHRTYVDAAGATQVESLPVVCIEGSPPAAAVFTPESWLARQGFSGQRPTTLLYLKLQLDASNKSSPKLNAVQNWIDGMILAGVYAPNQTRHDWPASPFSFEEAASEAVAVLQAL